MNVNREIGKLSRSNNPMSNREFGGRCVCVSGFIQYSRQSLFTHLNWKTDIFCELENSTKQDNSIPQWPLSKFWDLVSLGNVNYGFIEWGQQKCYSVGSSLWITWEMGDVSVLEKVQSGSLQLVASLTESAHILSEVESSVDLSAFVEWSPQQWIAFGWKSTLRRPVLSCCQTLGTWSAFRQILLNLRHHYWRRNHRSSCPTTHQRWSPNEKLETEVAATSTPLNSPPTTTTVQETSHSRPKTHHRQLLQETRN